MEPIHFGGPSPLHCTVCEDSTFIPTVLSELKAKEQRGDIEKWAETVEAAQSCLVKGLETEGEALGASWKENGQ